MLIKKEIVFFSETDKDLLELFANSSESNASLMRRGVLNLNDSSKHFSFKDLNDVQGELFSGEKVRKTFVYQKNSDVDKLLQHSLINATTMVKLGLKSLSLADDVSIETNTKFSQPDKPSVDLEDDSKEDFNEKKDDNREQDNIEEAVTDTQAEISKALLDFSKIDPGF